MRPEHNKKKKKRMRMDMFVKRGMRTKGSVKVNREGSGNASLHVGRKTRICWQAQEHESINVI